MSRSVPTWVLGLAALGLFLVWSNSFIAIGYLLGADREAARFGFVGLTVARLLPASVLCGLYAFGLHPGESFRILRLHWPRLLVCAFLTVPGYNLALYYGQQHGVPAPVASLTTALVPLFIMILASVFLRERVTRNRVLGFAVAVVGMTLIGFARHEGSVTAYPLLVAVVTALHESWHSVLLAQSIVTALACIVMIHAAYRTRWYLAAPVTLAETSGRVSLFPT